MPQAQAPIVAPFSAGSPTPMAYNMPSPSTPSPAVYAPATAQPPAAVAPFQTLFGGSSPVVAPYSPQVSSPFTFFPACLSSCSTVVCPRDSILHCSTHAAMPFLGHACAWAAAKLGQLAQGLPHQLNASSKASLFATAERTTATNLRLCAANGTATYVLHDGQPHGDNASGLQHSHCASLCHCPHLHTTSCEGGSAAQTHQVLQLPVLLVLHYYHL